MYIFIYILTNPFIIFDPLESFTFLRRFQPLFASNTYGAFTMKYDSQLNIAWFNTFFEVTGIYLGIGTLIISFSGVVKLFFFDKTHKDVKDFFAILFGYVIIKYAFLVMLVQFTVANFLYSIVFILFLVTGFSIYYLLGKRPILHLIIVFLSLSLLLPGIKVSDMDVYKNRSQDAVYSISKWFEENVKKDTTILCTYYFALPEGYKITLWEDNYFSLDSITNKPILKNKLQFLQEKQPSFLIINDKETEKLSPEINDYIKENYSLKKQFANEAYPHSTYGDKYVYIFEKI
jgi:hypothetical protein